MIRYTFGLPMAVSAGLGAVAALLAIAILVRNMSERVDVGVAAIALLAMAVGCAMAVARLWKPEWAGMATIGGGDAGHHVWIANQLAFTHPRVYLGFTSFHTSAWTLAQLFGGPFEGMRAAFYLSTAGMISAGTLVLVAVIGPQGRRGRLAMVAGAIALGGTWYRLHLLWAHYNQADGFFAHLHGLTTVALFALAWLVFDRTWMRAIALGVAIVVFRFTYALNMGDMLVGAACLVAMDAWRRPGDLTPPFVRKLAGRRADGLWRAALLIGAGLAAVLAVYSWATLWPKIGKPGGITAPAAGWNLVGLVAAIGAGVVWKRSPRLSPGPRHQRLIDVTLAIVAVPALVIVLFLLVPSLPREYYFHKYALNALFMASVFACAAAASALGNQLLAHPDATRRRPWLRVVLIVALSGVAVRGIDKGAAPIRHSYLERAGTVAPPRHAEALHDPWVERQVRAVLADQNKRLAGLMQPRWPVFNFTENILRVWRPVAARPVKGLQEERWASFLDGVEPAAGSCAFWLAGPGVDARFDDLQSRHPKARVNARRKALAASPDHRCMRSPAARGATDLSLCWVCR